MKLVKVVHINIHGTHGLRPQKGAEPPCPLLPIQACTAAILSCISDHMYQIQIQNDSFIKKKQEQNENNQRYLAIYKNEILIMENKL